MKKEFHLLVALLSFSLAMAHGKLSAGETGDTTAGIKPSLELTYQCNSADSATLIAKVFFMRDKEMISLKNAVIAFTATNGNKTVPLVMAIADSTGSAFVKVATSQLPAREGMITYNADFAGSGKYKPAGASLTAKPATLEVSFDIKDSVRYIKVAGTAKDRGGIPVPLAGESVKMYVPSLFRPLPIGEITLDKDGTGKLIFPGTLIGDSLGNITIIAQIEESDVYGNVIARNSIPWAVPRHAIQAERPATEIWTPVAPVWMIITLIFLLTGVWVHYAYAVIQLVRIKRSSKQDSVQNNPHVY